ncbi:MAG TPA: 50S ribosomal protein L13 [Candidatus Kapabacteria bacterium]|nr:50S ribosomal protein L13 [Candidatus Kapabacteria bacterium]
MIKYLSNSTKSFTDEQIKRNWVVVDADGKTLGRLSTKVASILRGKTKAQFTPHSDVGDFVVVVNADKIKIAEKRAAQKEYYRNTLYPGGARFKKYSTTVVKDPRFVIEHAVKGMLPHNSLGVKMFKKLKVYAGAAHPHAAQNPKSINI